MKFISRFLHKNKILVAFQLLVILLLITSLFFVDYTPTHFSEVSELSDWSMEEPGGQTLRMTRELDSDIVGKSIMFYTSDSFVTVQIDQELIYSYGHQVSFCKSPGSLWQFVELPTDPENFGKTLTIDIRTIYPEKYTTKITTYVGSSGALIVSKLAQELPHIIVNLILLIYGVFLYLIYRIERSNGVEKETDHALSSLCIVTFFWSNCELFVFQLLFPSGVGQYFLYYMCFLLLPLCTMHYVEALTRVSIGKILTFHAAFSTILIVLQLTGLYEFTQSLIFYLVVVMVEMIGAGIYQVKHSRTAQPKMTRVGLVILFGSILVNSALYLIDSKAHTSLLIAKIGLTIYVSISIYISFENLVSSMIKISESEKVRDIAYMDQLTKIGNRYAFMRDIESVDVRYISLVSFDLNNLKYYNDSLGHIKGDQLIKDASDILKEVYEGSLYRTGGDEFISILAGKTTRELQALRIKLNKRLQQYNDNPANTLILEIACGFSSFELHDKTYEDILNRADQEMYDNKKKLKEASKVQHVR